MARHLLSLPIVGPRLAAEENNPCNNRTLTRPSPITLCRMLRPAKIPPTDKNMKPTTIIRPTMK